MSTEVKLGFSPPAYASRDAIHVAVFPATATDSLRPGQHVEHGVVDPFRTKPVAEGERYWLFLFPNTVTGMRHHWEHPAFPDYIDDEEDIIVSKAREFLDGLTLRACIPWSEFETVMIEVGENGYVYGTDLVDDLRDFYWRLDEPAQKKFWECAKVLWGVDPPDNREGIVFRCSC